MLKPKLGRYLEWHGNRIRVGVEERATEKQRQSNIDFHSWRRWFIRRAVEALEKGGAGYTPWTIAHVVGHKVEDGTIEGIALPLGMTMGRYAGAASWEAMTACVKAVSLPKSAPKRRDDLLTHAPSGRRRTKKYRATDATELDKRPDRQLLSPLEAWEEVRAISLIRQELMAHGWLPPREKDALEREGPERGTLFEGTPTRWASSRSYEKRDFLTGGWKHFGDE